MPATGSSSSVPTTTTFGRLIELATERGTKPTVVQAWLDDVATGNKRLLLWDGELLGAVNRPVEPGDFRTGAPNATTDLTGREREIVARVGPELGRPVFGSSVWTRSAGI